MREGHWRDHEMSAPEVSRQIVHEPGAFHVWTGQIRRRRRSYQLKFHVRPGPHHHIQYLSDDFAGSLAVVFTQEIAYEQHSRRRGRRRRIKGIPRFRVKSLRNDLYTI